MAILCFIANKHEVKLKLDDLNKISRWCKAIILVEALQFFNGIPNDYYDKKINFRINAK